MSFHEFQTSWAPWPKCMDRKLGHQGTQAKGTPGCARRGVREFSQNRSLLTKAMENRPLNPGGMDGKQPGK